MNTSLETLSSPGYEKQVKWIRSYRFICGILSIIQVLAITFNIIKSMDLKEEDLYQAYYFFGNVVIFSIQIILMFLQMKAISKRDAEVQERIVFLCKVEIVLIPLWFGFGAIYCLRDLTAALEVGIVGSIVSIIQLFLANQIKFIFDDKDDGSHFELASILQI